MTKRQLLAFARHYATPVPGQSVYLFTPDKLVALVRALHDVGAVRSAEPLEDIEGLLGAGELDTTENLAS